MKPQRFKLDFDAKLGSPDDDAAPSVQFNPATDLIETRRNVEPNHCDPSLHSIPSARSASFFVAA